MFQELYQRIRIECPLPGGPLPSADIVAPKGNTSLEEAEFFITPG